jgi:hypothetical protein
MITWWPIALLPKVYKHLQSDWNAKMSFINIINQKYYLEQIIWNCTNFKTPFAHHFEHHTLLNTTNIISEIKQLKHQLWTSLTKHHNNEKL